MPIAIERRLRDSGPFAKDRRNVIPVMGKLIKGLARRSGGAGFPHPFNKPVGVYLGLFWQRKDRLEARQGSILPEGEVCRTEDRYSESKRSDRQMIAVADDRRCLTDQLCQQQRVRLDRQAD